MTKCSNDLLGITMLNELDLMQVITCILALENICRHPSSALTTTIISWTMPTAGSYRNMTAGHWYNCILAHSRVFHSFVQTAYDLSLSPPWHVRFLCMVAAGWWWGTSATIKIISHKHDTFVLILPFFNLTRSVFMSELSRHTLLAVNHSIPTWESCEKIQKKLKMSPPLKLHCHICVFRGLTSQDVWTFYTRDKLILNYVTTRL